MHVPVGGRDATVAHHVGHLVQRLGQASPEVPVIVGTAHVSARIALDRMVEVGEFQRVAEEKHRRVVADHVPIALLGVELKGVTANIALRVRRTALAGHGGEAREHRSLLADFGEDPGLGVAGDVMGHHELAEGTGTLGMHAPLGDDFTVEVGELFKEPYVLQQHRAARARSHDVLVIHYGSTGNGCELRLVCHGVTPCIAFDSRPGTPG
ncbi:hypothetical protein D3C77_522970 [compost metagenome]